MSSRKRCWEPRPWNTSPRVAPTPPSPDLPSEAGDAREHDHRANRRELLPSGDGPPRRTTDASSGEHQVELLLRRTTDHAHARNRRALRFQSMRSLSVNVANCHHGASPGASRNAGTARYTASTTAYAGKIRSARRRQNAAHCERLPARCGASTCDPIRYPLSTKNRFHAHPSVAAEPAEVRDEAACDVQVEHHHPRDREGAQQVEAGQAAHGSFSGSARTRSYRSVATRTIACSGNPWRRRVDGIAENGRECGIQNWGRNPMLFT